MAMSAEPVAERLTVPDAAEGDASDTDGAVLSTVNATVAEVSGPLPARSQTLTSTSAGPSGLVVEFQFEPVTGTKLESPVALIEYCVRAGSIPEVASEVVDVRAIVPESTAAEDGEVITAEAGPVLSIVLFDSVCVVVLPVVSVKITSSS